VGAAARREGGFESRCAVGIGVLYSWSLVLDVWGEMSRRNPRFRRLIDGGCGVGGFASRLHFTLLAASVSTITAVPLYIFHEK